MISLGSTSFKYIDRNYRDSMVLIPGWATDYRIFDFLDLKYNYLIPINFSPFNFEDGLIKALRENNINKVSLFGWSLGGFVAQEFTLKYPDLIDELILVSIRKRYNLKKVAEVQRNLEKNKRAYLYKFYTQSFCKKSDMRDFRKVLLKSYLEELDLGYLIKTLDYLTSFKTDPKLLKNIKRIKIIHGENDKIAPIKEALEIKKDLPQAEFITIKDAGHMPFLKGNFNKDINEPIRLRSGFILSD